jgi:hypothetical protein
MFLALKEYTKMKAPGFLQLHTRKPGAIHLRYRILLLGESPLPSTFNIFQHYYYITYN